ncbi:TPA: restriction endonuclease subunit S [Escherichia coli]|nr:restriction endonuclease subunit S [Escherichia coli]HCP2057731.1 restriction endonuclease subunit S [Escherichia coli]HCP2212941.1 restriction endonuclease subunit S [Escherichia coli]
MSELSYLEKLLDGVEVEWKSLGDVVNFQRGRRLVKSQLETRGKYAVYQNSMTPLGYYHEYNVAAQSSFIICAGAAGEIGYSENEFWAADDVHFAITPEYINDRFLFHFLLTQKNKISGQVRRASIPRLSKSVIEKLEFPIPCPDNPEKSLAIQSEIVRILDKFTALTAELTAELNMRKKQYNYYRDQLLTFKEGEVEWKALGEIGEFIRGKRFTKADYVEDGGISVIHYGEIYTRYGVYTTHSLSQVRADMAASLRYAKHGDVVITDVGETVEDVGKAVAWLGDDDIAIHDHCYAFRHSLNPKFISYYMQTDSFISEKAKYVARTKVNTLLINGFSKIMIPVPYPKDHEKSLKEQARIVEILDKFDTLTNSITEGLPREIELRQKQYEYYRDLLFSFPKPETVSN